MTITVTPAQQPEITAPALAQAARQALRDGDLRRALHLHHRAAELAPENSLYRLDLAILYDRLGNAASAALLYRQVAQAYAAHDPTLPRDLDITTIQQRLAYLARGQ
jgi:Flp pilus assembly protein TadD